MTKRIVIVGGGLAGLSAAEVLSARGLTVTVLESRPRLGGRASSFDDKKSGMRIDNCQHVSLGCCTNFRHFCNRTGLGASFREEHVLTFIGRDGLANRLMAVGLPAPFHLLPAFSRLSYLNRRDRACLVSGLKALAKSAPTDLEQETFSDWLIRHRQTENAVDRFWYVVLVSALSESLDRISAAHARKVFVDAFLANRDGWMVQIPTEPLDTLYGSRLTQHLAGQGAVVRIGAGVNRVIVENDRIVSVELRNGERVSGDEFIVAVPQHRVRSLLPDTGVPELIDVDRIETAPISSVHLWFDRPITDLPHAVLVDRLGQWVFNRSALLGDSTTTDGLHYYQVVISASRHVDGRPAVETIEAIRKELADIWPVAKSARLNHSRLVTEHHAVFSVAPGSDQFRPAQQSSIPNLQFAGDWTRTGWPATMEGATRSGYLAAENVLGRLGTPERIVQPDLPIARLSRWLFGLHS